MGNGTGNATGTVNAPGCGLSDAPYDLDPTYFAAEAVLDHLQIRLQRGSDHDIRSDGIVLFIADPAQIRRDLLGTPLTLSRLMDAPVRMALYLNQTCPIDLSHVPVSLESESGSITFESIYAPEVNESDVETSARFINVRFVDPSQPGERNALLNGQFRFLYTRGRPAQRFP